MLTPELMHGVRSYISNQDRNEVFTRPEVSTHAPGDQCQLLAGCSCPSAARKPQGPSCLCTSTPVPGRHLAPHAGTAYSRDDVALIWRRCNGPVPSPTASSSVMLRLKGQRRGGRRAPSICEKSAAPGPACCNLFLWEHRSEMLCRGFTCPNLTVTSA